MNAPALRISRSHYPVTALGPGVRLGVWVQGCPLACKGCMSRDTWDAAGGVRITVDELVDQWKAALADGATGLTVSGGEPFAQPGPLAEFLRRAAEVRAGHGYADAGYGEPDVLLYTGYELDELDRDQLAATQYADALITGRYQAGRPTDLIWRGSANQRLQPLTELGRRRYESCVDKRVASPALQLRVDTSGVWIIGVPRPGTLSRIDRALRRAGVVVDDVTWRPSRNPDGARSEDGTPPCPID
ncbi:anaerobic ribonucleoside-triphosphate reductase activating protein [Catenulispora sp. MAP5-51]|uniref:4Fe-4S single cluster domain-containing protein n=1 Tax=Catenulispora sp. MAP5-51 TaxID=3156298 RepID=UPI0035168187